MDKIRQGLVYGVFAGDVCCAGEGGALLLVEGMGEERGKRGKGGGIGLEGLILLYTTLTPIHPHTYTLTHSSYRAKNSVKQFSVRWNGKESSFGVGKFSTIEDLLDHFESKPVIGGESGMSGDM